MVGLFQGYGRHISLIWWAYFHGYGRHIFIDMVGLFSRKWWDLSLHWAGVIISLQRLRKVVLSSRIIFMGLRVKKSTPGPDFDSPMCPGKNCITL
jgi:hypothetical protein